MRGRGRASGLPRRTRWARNNGAPGSVVTPPLYRGQLSLDRTEHQLSAGTILDTDEHLPHVIKGLSLEISRQADRIRRRSLTRDWAGAASVMTELEEATQLLGRLVNVSLHNNLVHGAEDEEETEAPALPVGQYL